jgi:biopolymer transport protein ExbD
MKQHIFAATACVLFLSATVCSQTAGKGVPRKVVPTNASDSRSAFPGYRFEIRIDADKTSHLEMFTGYEYQDLDNGQLKKALTEYLSMQSPPPGRKPVGPEVVIRPDETLDLQTIVDVVKTARVSEAAEVRIVTPEGQQLGIPIDPRYEKIRDVKPNPLYLLVSLNDKNVATLNNDNYGNLADLSLLVAKLKEIFRDREINGVFRERSYEIEKSIHIRIYQSAKFVDLIKLAKELEEAGAGPLTLEIDAGSDLNVVTIRKVIQ